VADHAEARQDQDVHFGVAEEPEQMLVQDRVTAARRVEERGAEMAVGEQHGDGARQNRQRQQEQEHRHQDRPHEQRHLMQGHARRAHVEDGGDEVDGAQDRGCARDVQREDGEVHGRAGRAGGGKRRIKRPAAADTDTAAIAFHEHGKHQESEAERQEPEGNVVHARERHIRRPDHQRHQPVAEAADHGGHDHEEHHDQAVAGHEDVKGVRFLEHLQAGIHQLGAHHHGEEAADAARHDRKDQVHGPDVFVIGGIDVAPPAGGVMGVVAAVMGVVVMGVEGGGHGAISYFDATRVASFSIAANFFLEAASHAA
jgi:hypothetical protein